VPKAYNRSNRFDFPAGKVIGGKYTVQNKLGGGTEGEVYRVIERGTDIHRAVKVFYPKRASTEKDLRAHARRLHQLRHCPAIVQYIHSAKAKVRGETVMCLVSELVEGEPLDRLRRRRPGKRFDLFEALHILHALAVALEPIHKARAYHGDIHAENVLVRRCGIDFNVRLLDLWDWGRWSKVQVAEDVRQAIMVFHEMLGGREAYPELPAEAKTIIKGLRKDLLRKAFPDARALRDHLETFEWVSGEPED
jgi:serine/threonine protein kinase